MSVPLYVGNTPNRLTGPETFSADTDIYHAWLPTAIAAWNADIAALNTNDTRDTSTSSVAIGTGTKVFTVSSGKSFSAGQWLTISNTPSPTNQMIGLVVSYSGVTLTVTVPANGVFGSGTLAAWTIALSAAPSAQISGVMLPVTTAVSLAAGRTALDVYSKAEIVIKNCLHNSNFQINQRAVSGTVVLAAGVYGHDRWKAGVSGCTYTFASSGGITTITISAGSLVQVVNGADLLTGTYTVHWAGTAQGRVVGGSYASSSFTLSATAGTAVSIEFGTGTLSKPKMNEGNLLSVWVIPSLLDEQIYSSAYLIHQSGAGAYGIGQAIGTTTVIVDVRFPIEMVSAPTVISSNNLTCALAAGGASAVSATTLSNQTRKGATVTCTTTGMTAGNASLLLGGAAGVLLISCEP